MSKIHWSNQHLSLFWGLRQLPRFFLDHETNLGKTLRFYLFCFVFNSISFFLTAIMLHNKQCPNLSDLDEYAFCCQVSLLELAGPAPDCRMGLDLLHESIILEPRLKKWRRLGACFLVANDRKARKQARWDEHIQNLGTDLVEIIPAPSTLAKVWSCSKSVRYRVVFPPHNEPKREPRTKIELWKNNSIYNTGLCSNNNKITVGGKGRRRTKKRRRINPLLNTFFGLANGLSALTHYLIHPIDKSQK